MFNEYIYFLTRKILVLGVKIITLHLKWQTEDTFALHGC